MKGKYFWLKTNSQEKGKKKEIEREFASCFDKYLATTGERGLGAVIDLIFFHF